MADDTSVEPEADVTPPAPAEEPKAEAKPKATRARKPKAEVVEAPVEETVVEPEAAPEPEAVAEEPVAEIEPEVVADPVAEVPTAAASEAKAEPKAKAAPPAKAKAASKKPAAKKPAAKKPAKEAKERGTYVRTPAGEPTQGQRRERRGVVVSNKGDKSITVRVDVMMAHPKYKKIMKRSIRLHAHDAANTANIGDIVRIVECRPMSKTKRWRLIEIVEVAK